MNRRRAGLPARPRVEPSERDEPVNTALDTLEQLARNIIAAGGEAALRVRLARLLPQPQCRASTQ